MPRARAPAVPSWSTASLASPAPGRALRAGCGVFVGARRRRRSWSRAARPTPTTLRSLLDATSGRPAAPGHQISGSPRPLTRHPRELCVLGGRFHDRRDVLLTGRAQVDTSRRSSTTCPTRTPLRSPPRGARTAQTPSWHELAFALGGRHRDVCVADARPAAAERGALRNSSSITNDGDGRSNIAADFHRTCRTNVPYVSARRGVSLYAGYACVNITTSNLLTGGHF